MFIMSASFTSHPLNSHFVVTLEKLNLSKFSSFKMEAATVTSCFNIYVHQGSSSLKLCTRQKLRLCGFSGHFCSLYFCPVMRHHGDSPLYLSTFSTILGRPGHLYDGVHHKLQKRTRTRNVLLVTLRKQS